MINKELIEKIENKVNNIDILDKDPFVEESCKNIYRALLVVAENENPPINDILSILNDTNKSIELLKKFDSINKEKYNGNLSYIIIDGNNYQTLLYLIELLKQSMNITTDLNNINKSTDLNIIIDKFLKNEISATEIEEGINSNKIKFSISNSIEYNQITKPLTKRYNEMFDKGVVFYADKAYPPRLDCFICLLKAIENKKNVEYYYNEYWKKSIPQSEMLKIKNVNLEDINIILNSVLTTSTFLNVEKIKDIKFLPNKQGYTIEVSDGNRKLYMGVSEYGYVEIVRENSIDGKIIYMPDDDYVSNEKVNSNIKEIYYDFVPYKQIGTIKLDLINKDDFQPSSIELINNNWFNTAICQPRLLDSPDLLNSRFGESRRLFLRYENHTIKITCNLKKFIENLKEICDDIITIDSNSENSIDNKIIYTKKLGIIAYADFLKEYNDYYIFAIHFDGKNSFDAKIAEISNTNETSNLKVSNKDIYTLDQKPWIEYLEIDEETGKRKLKTDTPEDIVKKYNQFVGNVNNNIELNNNSPMSKIKNFFHIDSKNNDVTKFAQEHGYKDAKYIGSWKEYKVYEPYVSGDDISFTGLPLVILVNDNGEIRMSTSDEAIATLDDESFIKSFEDNKNVNETKLIREHLINLITNFKKERNKYNNTNVSSYLYLDYLEKIESMLNSYSNDNDDSRFNRNIINNNWISNDDAINYLFDNIIGNVTVLPTEVPQGHNSSDLSIQLDQYYKDGYVCRKEKDMLLNIINEIKEYINSSNNDSFIKKYKIDKNKHEIDETKKIKLEEKQPIEQLVKTKIENTEDYITIMQKVKWEIPTSLPNGFGSFAISIPYEFIVDGTKYNGIYELNDAEFSTPDHNPKYNFFVTNLTSDGKMEVLIERKSKFNNEIEYIDNKIAELEVEKNKIDKEIV